MAWTSGRRNSCPKQRVSDCDSSSEEETPFVSNLLKNCSFQNGSCNHSNCSNHFSGSAMKNKSSGGEKNLLDNPASCSNINPNGCTSFCNPISFCGNSSQSSVLPPGIKRNNLPSIGNISSSSVLPPASNARIGKSLNLSSISAHSSQGNNGAGNFTQNNVGVNGTMPNANAYSEGASNSLSNARGGPIDSCVTNNGCPIVPVTQMSEAQRSATEIPINQDSSGTRNNVETNIGPQMKLEKISNMPQHNSSIGTGTSGTLYNWQATMTTVKERFAFLFNNEVLSDVHFRVGKGDSCQRIPAHKFVLAVGSAVFDAMFNGKLCTRQEEIELPDVEPQAFLSLLQFLYSDEVQIGPETVMTVLYTAKKYAVPALERHCVEYLKCNLSPDNAFMLLTQARLFDEPQLAALCLDTIDKNTNDALMAEGFTDIDHSTLCMVLERDTLRIREAKLFQAVVRWSEAKCIRDNLGASGPTQRTILAEALSLVRFPLMTIEEFAQGPAQSGILTDKENVQLFLYFTVNPKPPVNFLDIPRCCMTGKEQTVCRFQQIESRWGYSGTSDRIRFIVDRRIFVVGFGMYGSIHGPSEYEVTIQIIHTGTGKVCISNDTSFVSDGTVNTFRVMFKEPFEVLPNTNYTAYATLKGPDSHYGTKGVRKISVECLSGDRVTFQFTYAAGNNNGTSVEDGQIPEIIFYT